MLLMAVISKQEIDGAIQDMNETTASVTRHKDDIAALIHATYRLRTNAIYGLYDEAPSPSCRPALRRRTGDWRHPDQTGCHRCRAGQPSGRGRPAGLPRPYPQQHAAPADRQVPRQWRSAAYEQARLHFRDLGRRSSSRSMPCPSTSIS